MQLSTWRPLTICHTDCQHVLLQAVKLYSQAISGDRPASILFQKRAAAHSALGHHKLALTDLTAAIDLDPKQLSGYLHRSGPGCASCAQALNLSSPHQALPRRLTRCSRPCRGRLLRSTCAFDAALRDFDRLLELRPGHKGAVRELDRLRRTSAALDSAVSHK